LKRKSKYNGLISSLDIFASSVRAAGIEDYSDSELDGVDLIPYLNGDINTEPHKMLFWRKDKMAAVRQGNHKLIRLDDYGSVMYNLNDDISKSVDLSSELPAISETLENELKLWEEEMTVPLWYEEEEWNLVTYEIHQALMENRKPRYTSPRKMKSYNNN